MNANVVEPMNVIKKFKVNFVLVGRVDNAFTKARETFPPAFRVSNGDRGQFEGWNFQYVN